MASLNFKGKTFVQNHHLAVEHHELIPVKEKSVLAKGANCSLHDNLIIHGDNLKALKALLPTYAGKVKCIYIDPPYNTGKENWVYNDNVSSPLMKEWLGKVVDKEDLTRHEKWLCMMTPRLKLLKELLSEDGAIFVHIDDHEIHRLRSIMDEIFGEENLLANFVWRTDGNFDNQAKIKICHEYVLGYARHVDDFPAPAVIDPNIDSGSKLFKDQIRNTIVKNGPKNPISKVTLPIGFPANFAFGRIPKRDDEWPHFESDAIIENNKLKKPVIVASGWSSKELLQDFINSDFKDVIDSKGQASRFEINAKGTIEVFKVRSDEQSHVLSVLTNMGNTQNMSNQLASIGIDFDYPKPVALARYIISLINDKNAIILDSFPGSGTTGHAVLQLNKEDGGNRKFILIECEEYADKITAERVRRVIKGVPASKDENLKAGLGGTFSFFELGKPIAMESILSGKSLPTFAELARFVFYTATGDEFDESKIDEKRHFIGETKKWEVYLYYKPDIEYLKATALNLEDLETLGKKYKKRRLIFAPTKYVEQDWLDEYGVDFSQLPFEIYRFAERT